MSQDRNEEKETGNNSQDYVTYQGKLGEFPGEVSNRKGPG